MAIEISALHYQILKNEGLEKRLAKVEQELEEQKQKNHLTELLELQQKYNESLKREATLMATLRGQAREATGVRNIITFLKNELGCECE